MQEFILLLTRIRMFSLALSAGKGCRTSTQKKQLVQNLHVSHQISTSSSKICLLSLISVSQSRTGTTEWMTIMTLLSKTAKLRTSRIITTPQKESQRSNLCTTMQTVSKTSSSSSGTSQAKDLPVTNM